MTYRAVPLLSLLQDLPRGQYDILEARAADGFVAQIPLTLIDHGQSGGAIPWIAIEPPDQRWPNLPGKDASAGPFYLIWQYPERSGVIGEQWPYQLPASYWPSRRRTDGRSSRLDRDRKRECKRSGGKPYSPPHACPVTS
jgi:hypothetical protein